MPADTATEPAANARAGREAFAPPDRGLLAHPLDYLLVDHLRMRRLCTLAEQTADEDAVDRALALALAGHLVGDLSIHGLDDEEDLHPLVRRRAWPEDRVEDVLGALAGDHALGEQLVAALAQGLSAVAGGAAPDDGLRRSLRLFASRLRRRVAVENALVMPLAGTRLTAADLAGLSRRMAARRGWRLAGGVGHA
ncbi:conserved hypothetical protein [Methylobacterium sp. 4-46]|uniref:hemerythrin domain-containing protein n=1 Tax=unclassified Methylobacterium TaxID=2615210 RepID=UPI000152E229|nr:MULTISPECIES: hemerythrin domain-containing protein [Methylobacterium]ACA19970.1 conserved hypothetical protein [Methylobacterium sp. 4-46]WFT79155.1 hemerythrin domain-containing protein [Methylobacterium nodulans]